MCQKYSLVAGRNGQERPHFCALHFCALQVVAFMMLGLGVGRGENLTHLQGLRMNPLVELLFHLPAGSALETACSEFLLVCWVSTEETGKEVRFNVFDTQKAVHCRRTKIIGLLDSN